VNIAIVVSGGLSETILATPLLGTLRAGSADAHLTLLCPEAAAGVAGGLPNLDEVIVLKALNRRIGAAGTARVWYELRRRRLDAVVLCSDDLGARIAAYFSATPQRVGPATGLGRLFLTASTAPRRAENRASTWLRLAVALGIPVEIHKPAYEPGDEARKRANALLNSSPLADGRLLIAIAPGSGFAATTTGGAEGWAPERYAHLANQLAGRHGAGIVLIGVPSDRSAIEETRMDLGAPAADVSGATDPATIAALLARCDLLIGGDTPLLHLAAGVGTPTVGLFGATDGAKDGPYGPDHRIIQALPGTAIGGGRTRATPATMEQIRVEDVLASIESS
jgi:heptosyltransferase-2